MNSEELKILIESAREAKGISQRELAKLTGISRSTLNDLINGKIKKVDIDDLRKIAETLDMSLQKLLKVAGYDEMLFYFSYQHMKIQDQPYCLLICYSSSKKTEFYPVETVKLLLIYQH